MRSEINILFLGGAKRVSLAERFIKAGELLGARVHIFSYELDPFVPISSVAKVIPGLKWNDPALFQDLNRLVNQEHINIILPFVDPAITFLASFKENRNDVFIPVSDLKVCEIFFNKLKSNNWFLDNGFPVPLDNNTYPKIAKPLTGSASKGIEVISSANSMMEFEKKNDMNSYIIQRYIKGDEYTVDIYISQKNNILATVPRKRLEITGGEVTKALTVKDDTLISLAKSIATVAKLKGPVNIQFIKEQETGSIFVMEINTRFGGGVIASIEAGADFTKMLLMEYLGLPVEPISDWKNNLIMMRTNREFFAYATNN